jgi:hypothetical protein
MNLKQWDGLETNVVIHAPMEDVIAKMKAKAELCVTSPPYGVGMIPTKGGGRTTSGKITKKKTKDVEYDSLVDKFEDADYDRWLTKILKVSQIVFWNVPAKGRNYLGNHKPFGQIVWTKSGTIPFANRGVIYGHEHIWLLGDEERIVKPIYSHWPITQQRGSLHPAPFPIELVVKAITHTTKPGDTVFDPFGDLGQQRPWRRLWAAATSPAMSRSNTSDGSRSDSKRRRR